MSKTARKSIFAEGEQGLRKAFLKHCDECNSGCPMGCAYRRNFCGILDPNCASVMACFARFIVNKIKENK